MKLLNFVAPAALIAAMTMSGGAVAQTMIGGQTVSEDDLGAVQAYCANLAAEANESLTTEDNGADDDNAMADEDVDGADGGDDGDDASDFVDATTAVNLSTITIEDCRDAGFE